MQRGAARAVIFDTEHRGTGPWTHDAGEHQHFQGNDRFMASSLLALLDDITSILDDVALLTKTAAVKATGVMGDDRALNAEQV